MKILTLIKHESLSRRLYHLPLGFTFSNCQIFLVTLEQLDFNYNALNSCLAYPFLFADVLDNIFDC